MIAAGLQTVYANSSTSGCNTSTLSLTPTNNPSSLPTGASWSPPILYVDASQTPTFTNWDFTGVYLNVNGTGTATFDNCQLKGPVSPGTGNDLLLSCNRLDGAGGFAAVAALNNCTIDGKGVTLFFDSPVVMYGKGTFQTNACKWQNVPGVFACTGTIPPGGSSGVNTPTAHTTLTNDYMSLPATNGLGSSGNHLESLHNFSGTVDFSHCLIDWGPPSLAASLVGGITSVIFNEQVYGTTASIVTLTDCIVSMTGAGPEVDFPPGQGTGSNAQNVYYPIRGSSSPSGITITGCAVQKGFQGYSLGGITDGGGNKDYNTGASIVLTPTG